MAGPDPHPTRRTPTAALLIGLVVTLATVLVYSTYISRQITGLRQLQTDLTDRNRRDSLQLLRIQGDLNQLALAMRDMLDPDEAYPIAAWSSQFDRIRTDLDDALRQQEGVAIARRTPEQTRYLESSVAQFWDASSRVFELAGSGREEDARGEIRLSLQPRQASLSTTVARFLVQNNESEARTAQQVQEIYQSVQRQVRWFTLAALAAIAATSVFLIRSNQRLFLQLATLSNQRRQLTQQLIETRESTLREISRELHDEFGQILTAIGSMLGRAGRHAPEGSPLRTDLREIAEVAQEALDNVRGLSQSLHPSILEELGLVSTVDWYLSTVPKQLGIAVHYAGAGELPHLDDSTAIHVYRILQEALSNVAKHAGAPEAWVRLTCSGGRLDLEIEDHGRGLADAGTGRGLGLVTMRERAALVGGSLEVTRRAEGGTLVRLRVPVDALSPPV
ncbi:MAG TPA: sensor histidine kinase [Vicinamibacterales bacterium]|nr:sensor histidine kinase [Vicinamibacterales bacterium]